MEYRITDESRIEAKAMYERMRSTGFSDSAAFASALDVLLVPVQSLHEAKAICAFCGLKTVADSVRDGYGHSFYNAECLDGFRDKQRQPEWCMGHFAGERCDCQKPFGPGTRLRTKNGDELLVIDSSGLYAVNLTKNNLWPDHHPWASAAALRAALLKCGAIVIE